MRLLSAAFLSLSVFVFIPSSHAAPALDRVLGRWDLTVHALSGPYPSWLELTADSSGVRGRFVGQYGGARPIEAFEYTDGQLGFALPPQFERHGRRLGFRGRFNGAWIDGTTDDPDGNLVRWTARRAPALTGRGAPAWGKPVPLLNGRDLSGWHPRSPDAIPCWTVSDGVLESRGPCSDLVTNARFRDFMLHVEFRLPRGSDSGIHLRGRYEVQLKPDASGEPESGRMGGVYGFLAPCAGTDTSEDRWHLMDVTLVGRTVTVMLDGIAVVDRQEIPGITGDALDSDEGAPGPIMLQGYLGPVAFRNLVVTPAR